jgi:hypothetical protein
MRLRLLNLAPDIVQTWREAPTPDVFEKLTPSHAILVNQLADEEARQELTREVVEAGITVAETRKRIETLKGGKSAAAKKKPATKPAAPAASGPRLALEDLAVYELLKPLIRDGATDVAVADLVEALERDMGWVKRLQKNGLVSAS